MKWVGKIADKYIIKLTLFFQQLFVILISKDKNSLRGVIIVMFKGSPAMSDSITSVPVTRGRHPDWISELDWIGLDLDYSDPD